MSSWMRLVVFWLAEVYLVSTVILAVAALAFRILRQPARRLMAARWTLASLLLLVPSAALSVRMSPVLSPTKSCDCDVKATPFWAPWASPWEEARPSSDPSWLKLEPRERRLAELLALFALGSAMMAGWLMVGGIAARRLMGANLPPTDHLRSILARVVGQRGKLPRLRISSRIPHPIATGLIRPTIVLPQEFANAEPDARIEAALSHEWAHIRNGDLWLLAASRMLLPVLFAHPLFAWLRSRIRADQEILADAVAASGPGRIAYAEALLDWARAGGNRARHGLAPSLGLGGRSGLLRKRITQLLDRDFGVESTCPPRWRLRISGIGLSLTLGLGLVLLNGSLASALPTALSLQAANHSHVRLFEQESQSCNPVRCAPTRVLNFTCQ